MKAGFRAGDKADVCYVELTIRNVNEAETDDAENTTEVSS